MDTVFITGMRNRNNTLVFFFSFQRRLCAGLPPQGAGPRDVREKFPRGKALRGLPAYEHWGLPVWG